MDPIYLDHNATTPVDPEVVEAMLPFLGAGFGNASSVHQFGRDAKVALENSREKIAETINCDPSELYFTSGGTESDNIAILGTAYYLMGKKNHVVVGAAEHHAILEPAEFLHEKHGFDMDILECDSEGFHSPKKLAAVLRDDTAIVSLMHGNNESGTIQDIAALASEARERDILFHSDAVQSVGKVPVDARALGVDLMSITGHKIYGPKGTGALFIRQGLKLSPLFYGGSQEKKRRPGTDNVAGVVGLAKALEVAERRREEDFTRIWDLAEFFIDSVLKTVPDSRFNGSRTSRLPQTMNMSFPGAEGESIILSLDLKGIAASSGSACTSGATEPSHVLQAMGVPVEAGQSAVRFSMGRSTTKEQLEYVLAELPPIIERLRSMSPTYKAKA